MNEMNAEKRNIASRKLLEDRMRLLVPISIALVLVGCNVDDHLNSSSQSLVTHNALASNALASNALASNSKSFTGVLERDTVRADSGFQ